MSYIGPTSGNQSTSSSQSSPDNVLPVTSAVRAIDSAARNALVPTSSSTHSTSVLPETSVSASDNAMRSAAGGLSRLRNVPQKEARISLEKVFQHLPRYISSNPDPEQLCNNCCAMGAQLKENREGYIPTPQDAQTLYLMATDLCFRGSNLPNFGQALSMIAILAENYPSSFIPQESCSSFVSTLLDLIARKKVPCENISLIFRLIKSGQIKNLTSLQTDQLASILLSIKPIRLLFDVIQHSHGIKIPGLADRLLLDENFSIKHRISICNTLRRACTSISEKAKDRLMEMLLQTEEGECEILDTIKLYIVLVKEEHYNVRDRALIEQKLLSDSRGESDTDYLCFVGDELLPYMNSPHILALLEKPMADMFATRIHEKIPTTCILPYVEENEGYKIIKRLAGGLADCKYLKSVMLSSLAALPKFEQHSNSKKIALAFFISGLFVDAFPKENPAILKETFQILVNMFCPNNEGNHHPITFQNLAAQLLNYFASQQTEPEEPLFLLSGLEMLARRDLITHFPGIDAAATFDNLMQNFVRYRQDPVTAGLCPSYIIPEIVHVLSQVAQQRLLPFCKGAKGQWMGTCVREYLDEEFSCQHDKMITSLAGLASAGHVELLKCISRADIQELLEECHHEKLKKCALDNPSEILNTLRQFFDARQLPQLTPNSIVRHQALRQINPNLTRLRNKPKF